MKLASLHKMHIGTKLSLLVVVSSVGILFGLYFFEKNFQEETLRRDAYGDLEVLEKRFANLEQTNIEGLSSDLRILSENQVIKSVFLEGDREKLYALTRPLFEALKEKYHITHLYFHLPDRTVFLRAHDPALFGDPVNRETILMAERSGGVGAGFELGKTAFALRVVMPYYEGDRLIGYVEMGKEIDGFLNILKEETGDEFVLFGDKALMDKNEWERVEEIKGKNIAWDQNETYAFLGETQEDVYTFCLANANITDFGLGLQSTGVVREGDRWFRCSGFPIRDVTGKKIGILFSKSDVTDRVVLAENELRYFLIFSGSILLVFIILFNVMVRRIISLPLKHLLSSIRDVTGEAKNRKIKIESGYEVGEISLAFNEMAESVERAQANLEEKIRERTNDLEGVNKFMIGRELRMIELKKEISKLKEEKNGTF